MFTFFTSTEAVDLAFRGVCTHDTQLKSWTPGSVICSRTEEHTSFARHVHE